MFYNMRNTYVLTVQFPLIPKTETILIFRKPHKKIKLILQHVKFIHIGSQFVHTWCVIYKFYILKHKVRIYNLNKY